MLSKWILKNPVEFKAGDVVIGLSAEPGDMGEGHVNADSTVLAPKSMVTVNFTWSFFTYIVNKQEHEAMQWLEMYPVLLSGDVQNFQKDDPQNDPTLRADYDKRTAALKAA